jgi:molybdate transport system substrate-binding protein
MRRTLLLLLLLLALPARAAELQVLSAGAVEPGLEAAARSFRHATGQAVSIAYATAPRLRARIEAGEAPDLLLAPLGLIEEFGRAGRLAGAPVALGRVGVGLAVRPGAPLPGIGDAAALRRALEAADRVVFNRASTGLYLDRLFERLGLTALVTPKAVRYATGAEVMEHLLRGSGAEIGFGAITEIRLVRALRYGGPLPPELQNYTAYAATLLPGSAPEAAALLRHLAGPEGRAHFDAAGIEAAR